MQRIPFIGIQGFVIRGKQSGPSLLGNNRPTLFRYGAPTYIPPSMTGNSAGMVVVTGRAWAGPFNGIDGPPAASYLGAAGSVAHSEWYTSAMIAASGRRKFHLFGMDVVTRQWSVLCEVPDFVSSYTGNVAQPFSFVDVAAKRIYYTCDTGGHQALYYADFTNGAAGVTMVSPVNMTESDSQGGMDQSHSTPGLFIGTGAHAGQKLLYFKNGFRRLGVIDLVANTIYDLNGISGALTADTTFWCMGLDAANAKVYILVKDPSGNTVSLSKFTIPTSGVGTAANYTITTSSIAMNGITLETGVTGLQYGQRNWFIPSLGVMLMSQRNGKMLAVRPV